MRVLRLRAIQLRVAQETKFFVDGAFYSVETKEPRGLAWLFDVRQLGCAEAWLISGGGAVCKGRGSALGGAVVLEQPKDAGDGAVAHKNANAESHDYGYE